MGVHLKTSLYIINDTYFTAALMKQKDVNRSRKRRKSIVFLGYVLIICWIIFAKKSEKSDELIHSIPLRQGLKNTCAHLFCRCMITGSSKKTRIEYDIRSKPVKWEEVLALNEKLGFGKPSFELGVHGLPC